MNVLICVAHSESAFKPNSERRPHSVSTLWNTSKVEWDVKSLALELLLMVFRPKDIRPQFEIHPRLTLPYPTTTIPMLKRHKVHTRDFFDRCRDREGRSG